MPPGAIAFHAACKQAAAAEVDRGFWLLHSFWYEEAQKAFAKAQRAEPTCSAAFWGQGLAQNALLWDAPSNHVAALAAARRGQALARTAVDRAWSQAVLALIQEGKGAFRDRLHEMYAWRPDDPEIASFYALALISSVSRGDTERWKAARAEATTVLRGVLAQRPEHPGALHYFIHANDDPAHAADALAAARTYGRIAPTIPHALHMPSHIFRQLGLWDEDIAANLAAFAAQEAWLDRNPRGGSHEWHSLRFVVEAYLAKGDPTVARAMLDLLRDGSAKQKERSAYFEALAEYVLETQSWDQASAFPEGGPKDVRSYVRGMAAWRLGNHPGVTQAIEEIDRVDRGGEQNRILLEEDELRAVQAASQGDPPHGLEILEEASATSEAALGDDDPVISPHELAADILCQLGRTGEAQAEISRLAQIHPGHPPPADCLLSSP